MGVFDRWAEKSIHTIGGSRTASKFPRGEIVDGVLRQATNGNIILFHDGGGDRSQTVAALPQVIDQLRAKGYDFVSVPELINKTRAT